MTDIDIDRTIIRSGGGNLRPTTVPLPATSAEWQRITKPTRTINDEVEDIHLALWDHPDQETHDRYHVLLDAVWDDETVEGSQSCDNHEAAKMIREEAQAKSPNHPLARKNISTLKKAHQVVLRRFGMDRPTRRNMVHGEIVRNPNNEQQIDG